MAILLIIVLSLILLYLFAMAPKLFNRRDMDIWKGKYFAHRGLHDRKANLPENSMAAFKKAIESGYGIELDVRLTKDHIPVVFHDKDLMRMCQVDKRVSDLTFSELDDYPLDQTTEKIPNLASVLKLVNGKVPLIIEFKVDNNDVTICNYTQPLLDMYQGNYCVESFNPLVLLWYKKNRPVVIRGQLSSRMVVENKDGNWLLNLMLQHLLFNFMTKPDFIAFNHKYASLITFKICRKLYRTPAFAWTIETQKELEKAKYHFDSFIFENFLPRK